MAQFNFPAAPVVGAIFTANNVRYRYTANGWVPIPQKGPAYLQALAPTDPLEGDFWWDTDGNQLYVYYNDKWRAVYDPGEANPGVQFDVRQTAHGFTTADNIGTPVYFNGSIWTKARADDADTVHVGVVCKVFDVNNFRIQQSGLLTGISLAVNGGVALEPGQFYRLKSGTTYGQITKDAPVLFEINAPVLLALSKVDNTTQAGVILPFRAGDDSLLLRSKQTFTGLPVGTKIINFSHTIGRLEVYLNGRKLVQGIHFISNGIETASSFTLQNRSESTISSTNDVLEAIAEAEVTPANVYSKDEADLRFPIKAWSPNTYYQEEQFAIRNGHLLRTNVPATGYFAPSNWNAVPINIPNVVLYVNGSTGVTDPDNPFNRNLPPASWTFDKPSSALAWANKHINYESVNLVIAAGTYKDYILTVFSKVTIFTLSGDVTIESPDDGRPHICIHALGDLRIQGTNPAAPSGSLTLINNAPEGYTYNEPYKNLQYGNRVPCLYVGDEGAVIMCGLTTKVKSGVTTTRGIWVSRGILLFPYASPISVEAGSNSDAFLVTNQGQIVIYSASDVTVTSCKYLISCYGGSFFSATSWNPDFTTPIANNANVSVTYNSVVYVKHDSLSGLTLDAEPGEFSHIQTPNFNASGGAIYYPHGS